jgi:N-acetylmuramoyl-L-alanine amidase
MENTLKTLHNLIIAAVGLIGFSFICGCQPSGQSSKLSKPPAYTVSIQQAASQLGLSVQKTDYPYLELTGPNNRVLLFLYDRGRVYVNGTPVCPVGKVQLIGGTYYISELLIPKIQAAMMPSGGYAEPSTSITPPKVPSPIKSGTIVVDAGHGGKDPGTTSVMGTPEKTINLQIAHKLADMLRQAGYRVVMTREGDTYIDKEERAAMTNRINPDLFVSVHCDSNGSSSHKGFTVYIARQPSWASTKIGRQLENSLSNAGIPSKGLRNADYVVLVQTRCPAVLVECGFLSNYDDASNLTKSWYQTKVARGIADGILRSI